jgi:TetR/AcrR family transcriptional regulator
LKGLLLTAPAKAKSADHEIVRVRRRQDRAAQTRQAILDAATIEFASKGFGGTTTRSITERANVRHGLLDYHFETKQGVWQAVMELVILHWHERLMDAVSPHLEVDDVAALRAFQRAFIELSCKDPDSHWLMSHEARDSSHRLSELIQKLASKDVELFIGLIRKAQQLGHYVEGDPAHLHYLFVGAASRAFMLSGEIERNVGVSPFDPDFVERHVAACEKLFFRNL